MAVKEFARMQAYRVLVVHGSTVRLATLEVYHILPSEYWGKMHVTFEKPLLFTGTVTANTFVIAAEVLVMEFKEYVDDIVIVRKVP